MDIWSKLEDGRGGSDERSVQSEIWKAPSFFQDVDKGWCCPQPVHIRAVQAPLRVQVVRRLPGVGGCVIVGLPFKEEPGEADLSAKEATA